MANRPFSVARLPGFTTTALVVFVALYLPIFTLAAYSFNKGVNMANWEGLSFQWYVKAWANEQVKSATLRSLTIGASASVVATLVATMAALGTTRRKAFRGQTFIYMLINQPLMVPEIVTAVATLVFFSSIGLNLGLGNVIIAHTTFCIPFAFMPIRARLDGMDTTFEQASRDLYASDWATFRLVTLPLLMPGVLAGAMLSFVISMDDFIITLMVAGAGDTTLPVYIYSMIRQGITPEVNAVSSILLLFSVVLVTAYWFITRQKPGQNAH